jgi:hypothetical protein
MKFDVVEMLAWFASMLGVSADTSNIETGISSRSKYASIDKTIDGIAFSMKASVALDGEWCILGMVAENKEGSCATLSVCVDRDVTVGMEDGNGVYTVAIYESAADVPWEDISDKANKVISSL